MLSCGPHPEGLPPHQIRLHFGDLQSYASSALSRNVRQGRGFLVTKAWATMVSDGLLLSPKGNLRGFTSSLADSLLYIPPVTVRPGAFAQALQVSCYTYICLESAMIDSQKVSRLALY